MAWNVEPWALSVPVAHAAAGADAAGADDEAPAAEADVPADVVAAAGADVEADVLDFVLLSLVPHAAAASNAPAVSRVAAMRDVLKG